MNLQKTHLADFYCLDEHEITTDLVLGDKGGAYRAALLALEAQLYPDVAQERDLKGLERQVGWGKGLCAWDVGTASLRSLIRQRLKLTDFLDPTKEWTFYDLQFSADEARRCGQQVKITLNFTSSAAVSDTQIVHQLLSQLGVKVVFRWSRSVPGHEGEKLKVYRLCQQTWTAARAILTRRAAQRSQTETTGSSLLVTPTYREGGDPDLVRNSTNSMAAGRSPLSRTELFTPAIGLKALSPDGAGEAYIIEDEDPKPDD